MKQKRKIVCIQNSQDPLKGKKDSMVTRKAIMVDTHSLLEANIMEPKYRGRLLEGITYNPSNDTLLWVDIILAEVHRVFLSSPERTHQVLRFENEGESIGAIGLTSNDNILIVCGKFGIAKASFATGKIDYFLKYEHDEKQHSRLRSNDAMIDPWGNLWVGVMTDFPVIAKEGKPSPEGRLYHVNCHDLTMSIMEDYSFIPNGLAFSNDGKRFFWTDSLTDTIWEYDYDFIANKLLNKRKFIDFKKIPSVQDKGCVPDGLVMTIDNEIYSAVFNSGKVLHFDTSGECIEAYKLPAKKPTCATIGGKNFDLLFVTTAHLHEEDMNVFIDPYDKSGDLGGFLYCYKLPRPAKARSKNIWGGKI